MTVAPMRSRLASLAESGLIALIYAFLLIPLIAVVAASLTAGDFMRLPPEGLSLRWFARFFQRGDLVEALLMSLRIAVVTTVVTSLVALMAALASQAMSRRLGAWFQITMILPLLIPELLTAIGLLFFLYKIGLGKTVLGLQIGHIVLAFPYCFVSVAAALRQIDPALDDASGSLGASGWDTFRRVTLPLAMPGLVMGAVFAFITSFDLYTVSLLLKPIGGNTLPLALFDFLTYEFSPTAAAAATMSVLLAFVGVAVIHKLVGLQRAF